MDTHISTKVFSVHKIIGGYEVEGTVTCVPAPEPGIPTDIVETIIDEHVENMVKNRTVEDLLLGTFD